MARKSRASQRQHPGGQTSRQIVIAVDFGTTYSGLAWAQTLKPEIQVPVIQWPDATSGGLEGITNDKVPTEIRYDGQDYTWGFQIPEHDQRHQWFKLDLDPTQTSLTRGLANAHIDPIAAPPSYHKTAEELCTDYLTALRKHAELVIRNKLPASAFISTPIEYVITVPAVWSDAAQLKTRKCAERAGMGQGSALHIISEPEAAAMYALDIMDPHNIKVGDTFILCDAGGGTVDLISYTVNSLKPTLSVRESGPGSGTLCGSTFLNRIFQKYIVDKLSALPGWDDDILEEAVKRFDVVVKRQFRGGLSEEFIIPVPGLRDDPFRGVRRGRLTMTGEQVKEIFEPVVKEVLDLIDQQIKITNLRADVKAVLLVGGFGQNAYLRDRIRAAIGGIEVMQSPNGIAMVEWFLKKGDEVKENSPFRVRFVYAAPTALADSVTPDVGVVCFNDSNNTGPPGHPKNPNVVHLVDLRADLSRIPKHGLEKKTGADGESWYVIEYEVEITYYSAFTKYELIHEGINYGAVTAEYT
ncbi:MAG: hypothetical protein OHK93_003130 [Ramalina farinacea]|uniref:Actin-like ATPase domain-containing protein n=1 Tax=Ramalina farinacea TaxID=258253 RepID=A0AA43QUH2_9LECA|nr:hypothetical protein [Ramalina farinacea]